MTTPRPVRSTILVVDDERGPRESLRMILSPEHEVLQARNATEALEILRTHEVDLVTLDLHMPGMGGDELMRVIRSERAQVEIIIITRCASVESATEGIRCGVADYLQKPFDVVQVSGAVARSLSRRHARMRLVEFLGELGAVVGHDRSLPAILDDVRRSEKLAGRLGGIFEERGGALNLETLDPARTVEFLEVLAETIEIKDPYMRGHARRVAYYASLIAYRMHLSAEEHDHVRLAAFLHDLGKVGVPTDLLLRPGALSREELAIVQEHPAIGARLIRPLDIAVRVSEAIRHHHEWWDGTGYPDGLAGTDIPLVARVIGVADAFDAMSSDRPYRKALSRETAVSELRRYAGVQFDPDVAKEFLAILELGVCDSDPELLAGIIPESRAASAQVQLS